MTMKNQATNMACCWVSVTVEGTGRDEEPHAKHDKHVDGRNQIDEPVTAEHGNMKEKPRNLWA